MKKFLLLLPALMLAGCSAQMMTRQFGGTTELKLACNKELKTIGWDQEHNLWFLEEDVRNVDRWIPQTYEYKEQSQFGVFQGTINVRESKCQ